jgi:MFS family permease
MKKLFNSKWYILMLTISATFLIVGGCRMALPVLFKEIAEDLNLNLVAVGTVWGIDPLAGALMSIPTGLIVDRFGVKRTMIVVCILTALFGAARGLAVNFATLVATSFLFGIVSAAIATLGSKVTAIWFKDKYLKLTNALIFIGLYLGQMVGSMFSATVFSPLLGGWRNVLIIYSVPVFITGLLWFTVSKIQTAATSSQQSQTAKTGLKQALLHVIRIKDVWIVSIVFFALLGSTIAVNGYIPLYLQEIGWDKIGASSALTVMLASSLIGTFPVIFISGNRIAPKPWVIICLILIAASTLLIPVFNGPVLWTLMIINGFLRSIPFILCTVLIIESREVGTEYAGTAIGFMYTLGMLGAFFCPPLGNSLAVIDTGLPFVFWSVLCILSPAGFLFLRKSRSR